MSKTSAFADVADMLHKVVKLSTGGSGKIRVFNVENGRKIKAYATGESIRDVDVTDLYAEVSVCVDGATRDLTCSD